MGNFNSDISIENKFYNNFFKDYLEKYNYDKIWVYYDEQNIIHKELQKKNDIDLIIDTGIKNISLSLKTVRYPYESIFFETVSNCNLNTLGWGYYSKADYIIYTFNYPKFDTIIKFKTFDVLSLELAKYNTAYGKTYNNCGKLLYKTKGLIIPVSDFEHKIIYKG